MKYSTGQLVFMLMLAIIALVVIAVIAVFMVLKTKRRKEIPAIANPYTWLLHPNLDSKLALDVPWDPEYTNAKADLALRAANKACKLLSKSDDPQRQRVAGVVQLELDGLASDPRFEIVITRATSYLSWLNFILDRPEFEFSAEEYLRECWRGLTQTRYEQAKFIAENALNTVAWVSFPLFSIKSAADVAALNLKRAEAAYPHNQQEALDYAEATIGACLNIQRCTILDSLAKQPEFMHGPANTPAVMTSGIWGKNLVGIARAKREEAALKRMRPNIPTH